MWDDHEWEDENLHRWADNDSDGSDAESGPESPPSKEDAVSSLVDYLVTRKLLGKMSAKEVCCISYWAHQAGLDGPIKDFALKPDSPTGHFERKFAAAMGYEQYQGRAMILDVPGHSASTMSRVVHQLPFIPAHEALHDEMLNTPGLDETLAADVAVGAWPDSYVHHPVTRASAGKAMPLALYMDGVPYTKNDGLLGVWVYNCLTQVRHFLGALRKSKVCRCGCRGWCAYYPVFHFLHWCFAALAIGIFPESRWDGPWKASDEARQELAGKGMSLVGSLFAVKGDWSEYANTFGFPTWSDVTAPCLYCKCTPGTMHLDEAHASTIPL